MTQDNQLLTTGEFSSRTGIPTSKVSRLIREGKIEAQKKSGKWMIHPSQLQVKAVNEAGKAGKTQPEKKVAKIAQKKTAAVVKKSSSPNKKMETVAGRSYTVAEFAEMTYLTEFGVGQWLKEGRLTGQQNDKGEWLIDAVNLQVPGVKRLVREDKAPG